MPTRPEPAKSCLRCIELSVRLQIDVPKPAQPENAGEGAAGARERITPGSVTERTYFEFILNQIAREKEGVEDFLSAFRRHPRRTDFGSSSVRDWKIAEQRSRREALESLTARPYFGRIDFIDESREQVEVIYVGSGTLSDSKTEFIYDWRANICSLYYQQATGAAWYSCPAGTISGTIALHRTFDVRDSQLHGYHDLGGGADAMDVIDDMLAGLLGQHSTGRMRQIVQSIQAEQDKIIRNPGEIVAVQGPAGSGKTIIALHRAAYLLYHQRAAQPGRWVNAGRMLALSPNPAYSSYIESVLPDLNEGQIQQMILSLTMSEHMGQILKRCKAQNSFQVESSAQQSENAFALLGTPHYEPRRLCAAFKTSRAMMDLIEDYAAKKEREAEGLFTDVRIRGRINEEVSFYSPVEMSKAFRGAGKNGQSLTERLHIVLRQLTDRINDAARRHAVSSEIVQSLKSQAEQIEDNLRPLQMLDPIRAYTELWRDREALNETVNQAQTLTPIDTIAEETLKVIKDQKLFAEDVVPILLLDGFLNGFSRRNNIDHVVIDEAQDYSLLHFEYIKNCLPETSTMTLVGDFRQATNPLTQLANYSLLSGVFSRKIEILELTKNYRSSTEISEFTSKIVPGDAAIESVRRTTSKPKIVPVGESREVARTIAALLLEQSKRLAGSTAVVCKTSADSEALGRELEGLCQFTLVTDTTRGLSTGAYVLPVRLAKGLEFDTVILHDAGSRLYRYEEERRMLYTACSRALHELYICYSGDPSPLLPLDNPDLFDVLEPADSAAAFANYEAGGAGGF